jgi:hypothetical protein
VSVDYLVQPWPGDAQARPAEAWQDRKELARALYDALTETPFGREVLRVSLEVFTVVDASGRLRLSLFGLGAPDSGGEEGPMPAAAGGDPSFADDHGQARTFHRAAAPPGFAGAPSLQVPQTFWGLALGVAAWALDAFSHPLTLVLALLGGAGYLAARYALETRRHRSHRSHGTSRHPTRSPARRRRHHSVRGAGVPRSP